MSIGKQLPKIAIVGLIVGGLAVVLSRAFDTQSTSVSVDVTVPTALSDNAVKGANAFRKNCAQCHGENGSGSDKGPPLVHDIYNPGHHSDMAFFSAVKRGVKRHHWSFGDMPVQPKVTDTETASIVAFIREVQRANGIVYREHRM